MSRYAVKLMKRSSLKPVEPVEPGSSFKTITPVKSDAADFTILRAALENLQDGFIIANQMGEIEKINAPAQRICSLLKAKAKALPAEIWRVCQPVLPKLDLLTFQQNGLDADIILPDLGAIRIRVQNIQITQMPYLLIVLEDRQQSICNKALSDAALLHLTERESEVWQLRLRGLEYCEISRTLWISQNTVKKHVKNILAKQRSHQDDEEYALMA